MADATAFEVDPKYDDYDYPLKAPVEQNGHAGYLTAVQQAQVHQLRGMLEAEGYTKRLDTLTLVRRLDASASSFGTAMSYCGMVPDKSCLIAAIPPRPQVRCEPRQADVRLSRDGQLEAQR
jgi:hypothetical protein